MGRFWAGGALLGTWAGVTMVCAAQGDLLGSAGGAAAVGIAAATGRLAFDALVQRDAPDANFGRSFARFETRFQLVWVIGAFIPVIVPMSARFGLVVVSAAAGFAAFAYLLGAVSRLFYRTFTVPQDPLHRALGLGMMAGMAGLLLHAIGTNTFLLIRIMEPFWLLSGLCVAALALEGQG